MNDLWRLVKVISLVGIILIGTGILLYTSYQYGMKKQKAHTAELAVKLSQTEQTLELTEGLYSKKVVEFDDLKAMLQGKDAQVEALKKALEQSQAKLLVAEQVSLTWKKAYEAAVNAHQTEEPPVDDGGVTRKRVDFEGNLGPIKATGHTLTDPPEAFLKLEQVVPLVLRLTMAQNKDESWTTFVTSSDPNVDVKIDLAGVNPLILKERWYQRIWLDIGATFMGDPAGRVGIRYQWDRFSIGADCTAWQAGNGCGASVGYRIFK